MSAVVVDTHAAIWYLSADPRISAPAVSAMDAAVMAGSPVYVPSICLVETTYLVEKGRLPEVSFDRLNGVVSAKGTDLLVAPLNHAVAIAVARIKRAQVPAMPDRIIAATALRLRSSLTPEPAEGPRCRWEHLARIVRIARNEPAEAAPGVGAARHYSIVGVVDGCPVRTMGRSGARMQEVVERRRKFTA